MKLGKQGQVWCWRFPKKGTCGEIWERRGCQGPAATKTLSNGIKTLRKSLALLRGLMGICLKLIFDPSEALRSFLVLAEGVASLNLAPTMQNQYRSAEWDAPPEAGMLLLNPHGGGIAAALRFRLIPVRWGFLSDRNHGAGAALWR